MGPEGSSLCQGAKAPRATVSSGVFAGAPGGSLMAPPPSPGQHLSHQYTQTSFTPWHTEKKKLLVLQPGAGGREDSHQGLPRGCSCRGPSGQKAWGRSLFLQDTRNPLLAGARKLCLKQCSPRRTVQRCFDSNNVLSSPTPLQALDWELFLSVLAFIFLLQ